MGTFFRTTDGRFRWLRVGGCFYLLYAMVILIGDGWRSLWWFAWFALAFGFFAISSVVEVPHVRSKWQSPAYLIGLVAVILGAILLLYRVVGHWHTV